MNFEETVMWGKLSNGDLNYYSQASEQEREIMRSWLRSALQREKITVEFIKANGEKRIMICTLSEDFGAKYTHKENSEEIMESQEKKASSDTVQRIWDCEANAWRSFRWDRLVSIGFTLA